MWRASSAGAKPEFVGLVATIRGEAAVRNAAAECHDVLSHDLWVQFRNGRPWPGFMVYVVRLPNGREEFWYVQ